MSLTFADWVGDAAAEVCEAILEQIMSVIAWLGMLCGEHKAAAKVCGAGVVALMQNSPIKSRKE